MLAASCLYLHVAADDSSKMKSADAEISSSSSRTTMKLTVWFSVGYRSPQQQLMMLFVFLSASISCLVNNTCTVTGPAVIDFHDTVNSVEDRCAYLLLNDKNFEIEILATFQERRRKDVSFLDSVTLKTGSSVYHLEQGGRVLVS